MITKKMFGELDSSNFNTASWAIWSNGFNKKDCIEGQEGQPKKYFIENISDLKNNVVFVGLNMSGNDENRNNDFICSMRNFHTVEHRGDGFLKDTLKSLPYLWGGYMTDISNEIESDSKKVKVDIEKTRIQFDKQLSIINSKNINIICFGGEVFNTIKKIVLKKREKIIPNQYGVRVIKEIYNGFNVNIFGVLHYCYIINGRGNHRSNEFISQLKFVNKEIKPESTHEKNT